jgi:hypothetical protein
MINFEAVIRSGKIKSACKCKSFHGSYPFDSSNRAVDKVGLKIWPQHEVLYPGREKFMVSVQDQVAVAIMDVRL